MKSPSRFLALVLGASLIGAALLHAAESAGEDTVITADDLASKDDVKTATTVFSGNVTVTATNLRLTCDRLEVVSLRTGDPSQVVSKQNRFKSLVASGHVKIEQIDSNRVATCGKAVVLPAENRITLTDHPVVIDNDPDGKPAWTWTGEELFLLRGEREIRGTKVKITGPQIKNLGFDKNLPPPALPAPPPPPAPSAPKTESAK